ncbi:MAG: hypothetical protein NXY57DRAFT_961424 [Lentinula lateritia]|nr:MAG: hypothetical protein NXY57DRAFT_961424 [Lentinula lateritia]
MFFAFLHVNLVFEGEVHVVKPLHRPDTRTELSSLVSSSTWYLEFDIFYLERTRASEDNKGRLGAEELGLFYRTKALSTSRKKIPATGKIGETVSSTRPFFLSPVPLWIRALPSKSPASGSLPTLFPTSPPGSWKREKTIWRRATATTWEMPTQTSRINERAIYVKNVLEAARRANEKFEGMESENRNSPPSTHSHPDPSRNDTLSHAPGPFLFLSALPSMADANTNASSPVLPLTLSASTMASTVSPDVLILALAVALAA